MIKIIFESKKYYDAIFEIQQEIRNKLKWDQLNGDQYEILEWVSDLICEQMNDKNLKHYWDLKDEEI